MVSSKLDGLNRGTTELINRTYPVQSVSSLWRDLGCLDEHIQERYPTVIPSSLWRGPGCLEDLLQGGTQLLDHPFCGASRDLLRRMTCHYSEPPKGEGVGYVSFGSPDLRRARKERPKGWKGMLTHT